MEHNHVVYDSDVHFLIDPTTRKIRTETSRKTTVIQFDHNSERFTFDIPRYIEGHDMSKCTKVEVHYLNVDARTKDEKRGVYVSDDLAISETDSNVVSCSWLISSNATQLVGTLNFIVRYCCVEGGVVTYAWNSAVASVAVSTGIDGGDFVATEYADILETWKAELFNAGYINASAMQNEMIVLKSRMDTFTSLKDGSTTGDAEVQDLRVGVGGNPYQTAGDAMRGQVENLVKNIDEICSGKNINVFWRYANDGNKGKVYKNDTGELITTSGKYSHSGLIPVVPNQKISVYEPEPNGNCITMLGAYFDADMNVVRGMGMHPNYTSGEPVIVTVPDGVFFIGVNYHIDFAKETAVIPCRSLPWGNSDGDQKIWCCVGDSLTEANNRAEKQYFDYVSEELGLSVLNYGVSGTGYKNGSFANRISNIKEEFDIMTIFGSFNDLDVEWDIGNPCDTEAITICGCVNAAIEAFFKKHPTKKLGIITPTPWKSGIEYFGKPTTAENMNAYVEALISVAKKHRLPYLDLYHFSGLNPDNATVLSAYFNENGTQDVGAHPNSEGHKFISSAVREFIKTLL